MNARAAFGLAAVGALPLVLALLALDAHARRASHVAAEASALAVVRRLPSSDLALSGGARWLRTPSLEEPGAAFSDGPASPDPDPAGGALSPPREAWAAEAAEKEAGKKK
ncbi:MAG TPA: hypothetical protein VF407_01745 [Polyangiaceae bacterium]